MDNTRIIEIIPVALKQGLLTPARESNICFTPSLNQANFLLYLLSNAGDNGLATSQITKQSGLHPNTCKCYLREFANVGLVEKEKTAQEEAIWYYIKEKNQ